MHLQSRQGNLCGRTGSLVFLIAISLVIGARQSAQAQEDGNSQEHEHALLHGSVFMTDRSHYKTPHGATQLQLELAHQHTLGMKDIGDLRAELSRSEQEYKRQQELFSEGITPRKDLETAREDYQKKRIDLAARRAEMAIDEAAVLHKHKVPLTSVPSELDETDIDRILQQDGDSDSHSYAQVR